MNAKREIGISKFLSYALRHAPAAAGIELDAAGWTDVVSLLRAAARHGHEVSLEDLERVVANNDKQRFALSKDGSRIRASQGHSVQVELGYAAAEPSEVLFHGTVERFVASIRASGLSRGRRQHVHLSADAATARSVGRRRGTPVVLEVRAGAMHREGFVFYLSANGVWLTDAVPSEYIVFPGEA